MAEYPLEFASRQIRRAFSRAVGRNIPKILTELITNADDSYRRLHQRKEVVEDPAPITIVFYREKRRFCVIDHAEGLTDTEMKERFVTYGKESLDRSEGFRTRSLFGKGLRDVLFTQQFGQVKSIKNGLFYNCQFKWKSISGEERPHVDIKAPARVTAELRKALAIPKNGTAVEFALAADVRTPQNDKLLRDLSRFYMLRMVNSSPHRDVRLKIVGRAGKIQLEETLAYQFPEIEREASIDGEIDTATGARIRAHGEIGLSATEMTQGEVGYVEREGGILILDEDDNVLDLQLFGLDEEPAARRISGQVKLVGAGNYIRERLNAKHPEEVLSETRDGLDRTHEFYSQLRNLLQPPLQTIVARLRTHGPQPKASLSQATAERHRQALTILNKLATEILGPVGRIPVVNTTGRTPPVDGIAFATTKAVARVGVLTPVALFVNPAMVDASDSVEFKSDRTDILVRPESLATPIHDGSRSFVVKMVYVAASVVGTTATISANWRNVTKYIEIEATEKEVVTPVDGIEFERQDYNVRLDSERRLRLFIDLDKICVGSTISIVADTTSVSIERDSFTVEESHRLTSHIAGMDVRVKGMTLAADVLVTASTAQFVAGTKVSVVKKETSDRERKGLFGEYKFTPLERKVQSFYSPDGFILINTLDPVNASYFGSEPYQSVETNVHCQVRLADLVLTECLWIMVSRALETGKLDRRFPDNPEVDVRNYVDEKKFEIGPQIHRLFVKD